MNVKYWHLQIIGVSSFFYFFHHFFLKQKGIIFKDLWLTTIVYFARLLKQPTSNMCGIEELSFNNYK